MLGISHRIKFTEKLSLPALFAAAATLLASLVIATAAEARQIYVPTRPAGEQAKGTVAVIESDSDQVVGTINTGVGTMPISAAVSPDGERAYVVSTRDDGQDGTKSFMNVIDTGSNQLVEDPIDLISGAGTVAASPEGRYIYIAFRGPFVGVFDTAENRLTRFASFTSIPGLQVMATAIAVSPDGGKLYVSASPPGNDPEPGAEPGVYVLPTERIFDPDPENLRCEDVEGQEFCLVENAWDGFAGIDRPFQITVTPDGRKAWVGSWGPDVTLLNLQTMEEEVSVAMGANRAIATAVNSDASRLYIGTLWGGGGNVLNNLAKIYSYSTDPLRREWTTDINLPSVGAFDLAVMPDGQRIYYSDWLQNEDLVPPDERGIGRVSVLNSGGGLIGAIRLPEGQAGMLAITPNQGPNADLGYEVGEGGTVEFDASDSIDPDGSITQYVWDFGDGSRTTTDSPVTTHRYASSGRYTASVRVIDNEGGSTEFIHTGRTAMHNGSAAASKSVSFNIQAGAGDGNGGNGDGSNGNGAGGNGAGGSGAGGGGVGGSGGGDDRCARPTYGLKVSTDRYIRAKDLKKGLKVGITSTHKSRADIKVSLRRKEINRLGLYKKAKKKKTVGTKKKVVLSANKERQVRVRITGKLRKAIARKRRNRVRIKVEVVSRATGVPRWRKMERRAPISTVAKRKGKVGKKKISRSAKVRAISPCAKRLKVGLKVPRKVRTKKALKLQIKSSAKATGTVELSLRGRDRARLRLNRRFSKRLYRAKVRLAGGRELVKSVKLNRKTGSSLSRALRSQRMRVVRAKLVLDVTGEDGQSVRQAKTVRLVR